MDILTASISIFITQLVFIGARTWNVISIGKLNIWDAIISGSIVHLSWLVSIAIGGMSMFEIIQNFRFDFVPVVICSLAGGLYGTYLAIKREKNKPSKVVKEEIKPPQVDPLDEMIDYLSMYKTADLNKEIAYKPDYHGLKIDSHVHSDNYPVNQKSWNLKTQLRDQISEILEIVSKKDSVPKEGIRMNDVIVKEDYFIFPIKIGVTHFQVRGIYSPKDQNINLQIIYYYKK